MDTRGFIFLRPAKHDQSLEDFATQIFDWLEIPNFREEWVGKSDAQQFVGSAVGIRVDISENPFKFYVEAYKRKDLEKYSFLIGLGPQNTNQAADYLVQHAHILAWRLSHEGFRCFVPKDFATLSGEQDGMVYDFQL